MNVSIEEKKAEAISRMKMFGIYGKAIDEFRRDLTVNRSEPPFGALYWVEGDDIANLHAWELQHHALVYHVVRSYTEFGAFDAYLFVGDYREEWDNDREDIKAGHALAYVVNRDVPDWSEFGYVGVKVTGAAGLVRVY